MQLQPQLVEHHLGAHISFLQLQKAQCIQQSGQNLEVTEEAAGRTSKNQSSLKRMC